jgi:hypothetical protein
MIVIVTIYLCGARSINRGTVKRGRCVVEETIVAWRRHRHVAYRREIATRPLGTRAAISRRMSNITAQASLPPQILEAQTLDAVNGGRGFNFNFGFRFDFGSLFGAAPAPAPAPRTAPSCSRTRTTVRVDSWTRR